MDGKIIIYAIALISLMGGVFGFYYTLDVDEAQKELILTQQELGTIEESIKSAQKLTDLRKETSALITAAHIIEAENEAIRKEAKKFGESRENLEKAFISAIEKTREATIGMVFPSISLSNGTTLRDAKIQALDENLTVIQHSQGVSKIPTESLSPELLDRLRFGFVPGGADSASINSPQDYIPIKKISQNIRVPSASKFQNTASDSLVRLAGNGESARKPKVATSTVKSPDDIKLNGDSNLWKGVERFSIGRAYVPGQGWLKIGSNGPIPGSGR